MLLVLGGITLYKTFVLYEEKKEFNVLQGRIPDFRNYTEKILNGADPVLVSGLTPVEIDNTGKVTKANLKDKWYSYEEKRWANAVILEDENIIYQDGEEIPENNIESYFVWIPKYSYQLWNLLEGEMKEVHEIPIKFGLENTSDEVKGECTTPMSADNKQGLSGISRNCKVGDYMTHPAFLSARTNGLWVGKFETGYKGATTTAEAEQNINDSSKILIKPNVYSWRNIQISNAFTSSYTYKREYDSHMLKNTEWGMITYLTYSTYGRCSNTICAEITQNKNINYTTGYAEADYYNGSIFASTTGNYTGIYDLNGGAWEFVMGNYAKTLGESGFTSMPINQYYDEYIGSTISARILGDATVETYNWYDDSATFIQSNRPWFIRGSYYNSKTPSSGIFSFDYSTGGAFNYTGFRIVLAIK